MDMNIFLQCIYRICIDPLCLNCMYTEKKKSCRIHSDIAIVNFTNNYKETASNALEF